MGLFDTGENNVGQFGADNSNIIRYKQAAEYAEDARLYALAAAESMTDADNLLNRAEQVLQEARDILSQVQDIESEVEGLETRVAAAEAVANEAIAKAQQAIADTAGIIAAAQGYADAASASASDAQGFRDTAQNYATSAQNAATQAQGFRDEADGFADEAEQHVTEAETAVTNATVEANRAKTEADRAAEIVAGIPGKETIDGFAKVYKDKADADADVSERTLGDKVLVWDNSTSVYTWYDVTGTANAKTLTLNSTEKKLKTINNVAPDDAGNVQITLPSGNPSLWLGETVFFQYDPEQPITYPGLLAQDGKEYNRADYPDLWNAINLGYVPSVSEADWQAGKKNAFSTGNGTSTFRVPLFSGEALRTPNTSDVKGGITDQVPYVVSVNGIAPSDSTGNIDIDLGSYAKTTDVTLAINNATANKAAKGANTDITSLSGLTTALSVSQGGTGAKTVVDARTALSAAKSGANSDITSLTGLTTPLSTAQGGTGSASPFGTAAGTFAQGNDSRLSSINGKSGGYINGAVLASFTSDSAAQGYAIGTSIKNAAGYEHTKVTLLPEVAANGNRYAHLIVTQDANFKEWYFDYNQGNAYAPNSWVNLSDRRVKTDIETIVDPMDKMKKLRGCTWTRIDEQSKGKFGIGFIAQDVQAIFPEAVSVGPTGSMKVDGEDIVEPLALSAGDVAAALHHEAILVLMQQVEELKARVATLEDLAAQK